MRKIDLITGFLGAGKTTFIRKYAAWLMEQGQHVGILENDHGAINVDMLLLSDLEGERCELEMISGGCCQDPEAHRRRFRTKLIAMGMSGYDRILMEPSGVYDMDEFFDTLQEEPLDQWYEIGNIIAIVDARLEEDLSAEADYLLASEAASAGKIVLSHAQEATPAQVDATLAHLNRALKQIHCGRRVSRGAEVLCKDWAQLTAQDFAGLSACGWRRESYEKSGISGEDAFDSLFFMKLQLPAAAWTRAVREIFADPACGEVFRVKGFFQTADGWQDLNATRRGIEVQPIGRGQEILIVIGEGLDKAAIEAHFRV